MSTQRRLGLFVLGVFLLLGTHCEREENDFDSCPPEMKRATIDGASLCACDLAQYGHADAGAEQERQAMVAGDLSFKGCNADDWVPEGYMFAFPDGRVIQVEEICKVADGTNTYVTHGDTSCMDCDHDGLACVPEPCWKKYNVYDSGCGFGEYCSPNGTCKACAALGEGKPGGPLECGGECGGCPDESMCVNGVCTGLVRCVVNPTGTCSEKAPTWCPIVIPVGAGPISGMPCSCALQFECNSGCNGTYQTTYYGSIE